jgi:hypothetical protein
MPAPVSRRDFGRLFALGGSAALFSDPAWAQQAPAVSDLTPGGAGDGEAFWKSVREQFVMPPDLAVMNAANLCPASRPALETLSRETQAVDRDPSPNNRARLYPEKENTRKALAEFLRVTPDEIIITRNTSESNNLVSNGLDLKAGDEVIVHADNHPSNLNAWREKGKRFGFTVVEVAQKNPHPGMDYYVDAFTRAITPRTKVLCFTHLSSTVGDLMPAKELCRLARDRGILTLVDGAQSLGLLDVNLSEMQPDFYAGSAHKWPCGARECGVQRGTAEAVAEHLQRLSWRGRILAHVRRVRTARRSNDDCVSRGADVSEPRRPRRDRGSGARAEHAADRGTHGAAGGQGVDIAKARAAGCRGLVPAGNPRCEQAGDSAVREAQGRGRHARRPGSWRAACLAAPVQQLWRDRSVGWSAQRLFEERCLIGAWLSPPEIIERPRDQAWPRDKDYANARTQRGPRDIGAPIEP